MLWATIQVQNQFYFLGVANRNLKIHSTVKLFSLQFDGSVSLLANASFKILYYQTEPCLCGCSHSLILI